MSLVSLALTECLKEQVSLGFLNKDIAADHSLIRLGKMLVKQSKDNQICSAPISQQQQTMGQVWEPACMKWEERHLYSAEWATRGTGVRAQDKAGQGADKVLWSKKPARTMNSGDDEHNES